MAYKANEFTILEQQSAEFCPTKCKNIEIVQKQCQLGCGHQEQKINNHKIQPQNDSNLLQGCLLIPFEGQKSKNLKQVVKNYSIYHNFQKHLVVSLKLHVKIQNNSDNNDPTIYLAVMIWNIFLNSKNYSKKILAFVFGVSPNVKQTNIERQHSYPGFQQITSIYPKNEIQLAQQYLRQETIRQGIILIQNNSLIQRKIKKCREFISYFGRFIEELQNGGVFKRLPKPTKAYFYQKIKYQKKQLQ